MTDYLDTAQRSSLMSRVKNRDTEIEIIIRSMLHRRGFRFRKNVSQLPGRPDVVLSRYGAVIFIHGCFWHGHLTCSKGKLPATRVDFWSKKIHTNQKRDQRIQTQLANLGWRIAVIWECAYSNKTRSERSTDILSKWIKSGSLFCEIPSN